MIKDVHHHCLAKVTFYLRVPYPIQAYQQAGARRKFRESQSCDKIEKSPGVALSGQDLPMPGVSSSLAHPRNVANEKNQISSGGLGSHEETLRLSEKTPVFQ